MTILVTTLLLLLTAGLGLYMSKHLPITANGILVAVALITIASGHYEYRASKARMAEDDQRVADAKAQTAKLKNLVASHERRKRH